MTGALDSLELFAYAIDFALAARLDIPAARRAILWRGAFGMVLRQLVCHDMSLDCEACPLRIACPYPAVFAPHVPEGRRVVRRLADPPRPFVITDPLPEAAVLEAKRPLRLRLVLVGSAQRYLPYVIAALRRMGEQGIGGGGVRFDVLRASALDAEDGIAKSVFVGGSNVVGNVGVALRASELARPGDDAAKRIRVAFRTPTDVREKSDTATSRAPRFGALFRRMRDRIGALATYYGERVLEADLKHLAEVSDGVRIVSEEVETTALQRRSMRTAERHPIGGVLGSAVYGGEGLSELMPWLRVAELVGVGKHATFGNGRIAVTVLG